MLSHHILPYAPHHILSCPISSYRILSHHIASYLTTTPASSNDTIITANISITSHHSTVIITLTYASQSSNGFDATSSTLHYPVLPYPNPSTPYPKVPKVPLLPWTIHPPNFTLSCTTHQPYYNLTNSPAPTHLLLCCRQGLPDHPV